MCNSHYKQYFINGKAAINTIIKSLLAKILIHFYHMKYLLYLYKYVYVIHSNSVYLQSTSMMTDHVSLFALFSQVANRFTISGYPELLKPMLNAIRICNYDSLQFENMFMKQKADTLKKLDY